MEGVGHVLCKSDSFSLLFLMGGGGGGSVFPHGVCWVLWVGTSQDTEQVFCM